MDQDRVTENNSCLTAPAIKLSRILPANNSTSKWESGGTAKLTQ